MKYLGQKLPTTSYTISVQLHIALHRAGYDYDPVFFHHQRTRHVIWHESMMNKSGAYIAFPLIHLVEMLPEKFIKTELKGSDLCDYVAEMLIEYLMAGEEINCKKHE